MFDYSIADFGYLGWTIKCYQERLHWVGKAIEQQGLLIAADSRESVRREAYPCYKERRIVEAPAKAELRASSKKMLADVRARWPHAVLEAEGAEADDIIAELALRVERLKVYGIDHDLLTIPNAELHLLSGVAWGIERVRPPTLPFLVQGEMYLAYQMLVGCASDSVPRAIHTKDRTTVPSLLRLADPLGACQCILPQTVFKRQRDLLMLPTPLLSERNPQWFDELWTG